MNAPNVPVPPELGHLSTFIDSHVERLAGSSSELRSIALCAAKYIFDWALETEQSSKPHLKTLLATLTETAPPRTRSRTQRRGPSPIQKHPKGVDVRETPLSSLFIEGMNIDQIWQQLDLRAVRVCENLQALRGEDEDEDEKALLEEEESDNDQSESDDDSGEMDMDGDGSISEELSDGEEDVSSAAEGVIDLQEESSEDDEDRGPPTSMLDIICGQQKLSSSTAYSEGPSDLDDGFFDLATFNRETSEIDTKKVSKRKLDFIADEDSAEESEVDLFGSVDGSETGVDDGVAELFYNDFFEPPTRIQNKSTRSTKVRFHERVSVKKIKLVGKGMPVSSMDDEDSDEEEECDV